MILLILTDAFACAANTTHRIEFKSSNHEMKLNLPEMLSCQKSCSYPTCTSGSAKEVNRSFNFLGVIILVGYIVIIHMILC